LKSYATSRQTTVPIADLRKLLDSKLSSQTDMHPMEALDIVYKEKVTTLVRGIKENFKGVNIKLQVSDLLGRVENANLAVML
jgi:hypothetical protein